MTTAVTFNRGGSSLNHSTVCIVQTSTQQWKNRLVAPLPRQRDRLQA